MMNLRVDNERSVDVIENFAVRVIARQEHSSDVQIANVHVEKIVCVEQIDHLICSFKLLDSSAVVVCSVLVSHFVRFVIFVVDMTTEHTQSVLDTLRVSFSFVL